MFETRWPGLLLQAKLSNHEGVFHGLCGPWGVLIRLHARGAKLILMAGLAYPVHVGCASLHCLLMERHCRFFLNACFDPPMVPHLLWAAKHPPSIDSICDITAIKKTTSKTRSIQITCRINYDI